MSRCLIVRSSAALVFAVAGAAQAAPVFFDGIFNNSDWTLNTVTNANGAGSFVNAFQMPVGGNPNQYRIVRNLLNIGGINATVVGVHMNVVYSYNPGSQGAISSINYSEDSINFLNQGGNGQGGGLAIVQGGITYIQRNPVLVMPYSGFSTWTANPAPGLVASDLWELTPGGGLIPGNNPDFSASGGVMQFGFWRGNSSGTLSSGTFNSEAGIDNWRVEIIPAPGAAGVLAVAGVVATRRRRR